ncbi:MAG TPA: sensor histidine kinase [Solirubrobacteraceae bacterium]|nr:sensor histidine kinase [Solirubrobacteraceae bacterium]
MRLRSSRSLLSYIVAVNALLVAAVVFVASLVARLNLGQAVGRRTFLVLALAVLVILLANALLLRRPLTSLERLIDATEQVDLAEPGFRVAASNAQFDEVARLQRAFNHMLDRLETERREAATAVLRGQEQERRRIAQDLHDEVNQALTAVLLRLEASIHSAPTTLHAELEETKRLAVQAMDELLQMARELRPSALEDHGLLAALATQVADWSERTGIEAHFQRSGPLPRLSDEQQLVIYRIAQESLSNVAQHANASAVTVELSFIGRTVLRVTDDGSGFSGQRNGGLGLSGMRERAVGVSGQLNVRSAADRGTIVELVLG